MAPSNPPDLCALCGEDSKPVLVIGDGNRTYLAACALCLCRAFDTLTGYHMEKMYRQYERLRELHAASKATGAPGRTSPKKGSTFAEVLPDST